MSRTPSPNSSAFMAVAAAIVAYRAAPQAGATDSALFYGWLGAGMAAMCAVVLAVQAMRAFESRPSPWRSTGGQVLWALRPRSFIVAWLAIIVVAYGIGLPALAIEYPPRVCTYLTWDGIKRSPGNDCPWWRLVRPGARP